MLSAPRRLLPRATVAGLGRRPREVVAGSHQWPVVFRYAQGSAIGNFRRHNAQVLVISVSPGAQRAPTRCERAGPIGGKQMPRSQTR
eukprot:9485582-Pyramimonas_sp.AAC.1